MHMDGDHLVTLADALLSQIEQRQQAQAILAARYGDGDHVAVVDHLVITNGLVDLFEQKITASSGLLRELHGLIVECALAQIHGPSVFGGEIVHAKPGSSKLDVRLDQATFYRAIVLNYVTHG